MGSAAMTTPNSHQLIADYMGLAQALAQQVWRTAPHALELDELRAIAYLGLVAAAERWKPYCAANGYDVNALQYFKPFAVRRIRGSMIDAIRASDWATRLLRSRARALQAADSGTGLTETELAERTGLTVAEIRATQRGMAQRPVSLEAEELDVESADTDVESSAITAAVLGHVVEVIRHLTPAERTVIVLHYYAGHQLHQVAKTMHISESRASQLHADAVLAIHEAMCTAVSEH